MASSWSLLSDALDCLALVFRVTRFIFAVVLLYCWLPPPTPPPVDVMAGYYRKGHYIRRVVAAPNPPPIPHLLAPRFAPLLVCLPCASVLCFLACCLAKCVTVDIRLLYGCVAVCAAFSAVVFPNTFLRWDDRPVIG